MAVLWPARLDSLIILMDTDLYVSFGCPMGNFIWVFAHIEVEEGKGGIVSH